MITPAGEWSPSRSYEILTAVEHNGNGYLAISDNTAVEPGTDDSVWMMFVRAGDTPTITADAQGNIYINGDLLTSVLADLVATFVPPEISTDIEADKDSTTKMVSPKAVYDFVVELFLSQI